MAALLPLTAAAQSPLESGHSIMVGDDTYDMTDIYQIVPFARMANKLR